MQVQKARTGVLSTDRACNPAIRRSERQRQNDGVRETSFRGPDPKPPQSLAEQVEWRPVDSLRPYPDNPRRHSDDQIRALGRSISKFGFTRPVGIDDTDTILYGHGCIEAAKRIRMAKVPTVTLHGLSDAQKRALVIADNRLAERSAWDVDLLQAHFAALINLDFEVELTGFSMGEIDLQLGAASGSRGAAAVGDVDGDIMDGPAVSAKGDQWMLGHHGLVCGDARFAAPYSMVLGSDLAQMVVTDPPYNVKIEGHARGRSRKKHREFAMASGEMSAPGFTGFLEAVMARAVEFSQKASIHYWFIDWRHLPELLRASTMMYSDWKNLLVWRKPNAGQGSFYRSQHELIGVFKSGVGSHINNFGLGAEGRYRSNVLDYPGGASPDQNRREELEMHPTVKPIALIADLMLDCSRRNGIVLDLFGGSGTTILAAEQTGRRARVIELDPLYVDLTIRRWQKLTGDNAIHAKSRKTFDALATGGVGHGETQIR